MAGLDTLGFAVDDHDPRGVEIYRFISDMDYSNGDTFCFKSGGDGDNGELILAYLDEFFAMRDEKQGHDRTCLVKPVGNSYMCLACRAVTDKKAVSGMSSSFCVNYCPNCGAKIVGVKLVGE